MRAAATAEVKRSLRVVYPRTPVRFGSCYAIATVCDTRALQASSPVCVEAAAPPPRRRLGVPTVLRTQIHSRLQRKGRRMMLGEVRLGELLVQQGLVTTTQLEAALTCQ